MSAVGEHHLGRLSQGFERKGSYPSLLFEGRWHDSGELFERSQRIASGLAQLEVAAGERVVVTMANCPEVSVVYQALWRAGTVVTPANFLLSTPELRHVIADAEACAVVTTSEFLPKVQEAVDGLPSVRFVLCTGDPGGRATPLAELEQAAPGDLVARADDDLAALLYTGGTTGRAKGVMLSHANLHFTGRCAHESAYTPGVNRALVTLPLSHAYGLLVTLAGLHSPEQGVAVLLRWFDPDAFLALIQEHGLQLSAVVPTMLQLLLAKPLENYDLSTLLYLTSGGAPLPREVEEEFGRRVASVAIRQGYGLTETAALVSTNPAGSERAGSVGRPVAGTELEIRDEQDRALAAGELGEICCRSPGVMRGYWNSPDATSEALRDGWLHTGDVGYQDEDGYLFIVDRKKDLIIRGGFNVYPRDVEDALMIHPAVQMAGVVGKPSPVHGEEVVAFVAPHEQAQVSPEELVTWSREHIGGYKYPREVVLVDALPLTAVGKIDRKALRTRARGAAVAPALTLTSAAKGLLVDLDGTLVDSSAPVRRAWTAFAQRHRLDPEHVLSVAHGRPSRETVALLAPDSDHAAEAAAVEDSEVNDRDGIRPFAGALDLLTGDRRLAIVTSCSQALATARLSAAGLPIPSTLVTSDELERGKPDPTCFEIGAQRLGLEPRQCLVIEDTPAGIAAGRAAGARVIAVRGTHVDEDLRDADAIVEDLSVIVGHLRPGHPR